jgi:hypothetical protein
MYTDALIMQDNVFAHPFYQRATRGALKIFLYLIDNPDDVDGLAHLPKEDRKRERAKLKKEKAKREKDEAAASAHAATASTEEKEKEKDKKVDSDPFGEKLLSRNFIEEANAFCKLISTRMHACDANTLALVAEVYLRRGKLVQVAKALKLGLSSAPNDPGLTVMLIKLYKRLRVQDTTNPSSSSTPAVHDAVLTALNAELTLLLHGQELQAFVANYVEVATVTFISLPHRIAAARLIVLTASHKGTAGARTRAAELVQEESLWAGRGVTLEHVLGVIKVSTVP